MPKKTKPPIQIYDTTLRDGTQAEGINLSVPDKLRIAHQLDQFGIHYIEGGWPGSNPRDIQLFQQTHKQTWQNTQIAAFGATRRKNTTPKNDPQIQLLLQAQTPVITIFGKTWLLHVQHILKTTPQENLNMIADTIQHLKQHNRHIIYDAEHAFDGYKHNPQYALQTWHTAAQAGAHTITLCDTNGGTLPHEIYDITKTAAQQLNTPIGIHTHDDIGLAVANTLAAIQAGATHIQGTINGYGERTGNCNLTTAIPNITLKMNHPTIPKKNLRNLVKLSNYIDEIANLPHNNRRPWVGASAFAHKGGMHVNAIQKNPQSFEHTQPHTIGNQRRILISDLSGRANILLKAQELNLPLQPDSPQLKPILRDLKHLEHQGYEYETADASLALLIHKHLHNTPPPFHIIAHHTSIRRDNDTSICQATIKIQAQQQTAHTVAEGDGPINALDSALRAALKQFFPKQLKPLHLTDYKVRIINTAAGTAAKTRVFIETTNNHTTWTTVGAHDNIIEASLQALADSYKYPLLIQKPKKTKTKTKPTNQKTTN